MTFSDIQEQFINALIKLGAKPEEAIKLATTFFVTWKDTQKEVLDEGVYITAVNEFLLRFEGNR